MIKTYNTIVHLGETKSGVTFESITPLVYACVVFNNSTLSEGDCVIDFKIFGYSGKLKVNKAYLNHIFECIINGENHPIVITENQSNTITAEQIRRKLLGFY